MPLYRITLAYDGTDFEGWQAQTAPVGGSRKVAARTVQGVVEEALTTLAGGARVAVMGAGRTDAGVHALGQVASFELPRDFTPEALVRALNGLLPGDVRTRDAAYAEPGFDARRSAVSKRYRYELDVGAVQLPTRRHHAGHHRGGLDRTAVAETAGLFLGRRDFAALQSAGSSVKTSVRTVHRSDVSWVEPGPERDTATLVYEVVADGFLRKMVRSMVGGLIAAGAGTKPAAALRAALERGDRAGWPPPAEARGLTLVSVSYS